MCKQGRMREREEDEMETGGKEKLKPNRVDTVHHHHIQNVRHIQTFLLAK